MTTDDVVAEIIRLHRSLPARPSIDEVEAAKYLIRNVEREDESRLEAIARQGKGKEVPEELFKILQEMQRSVIRFQSKEQKSEALKLLDLESVHLVFDDLLQRASKCLPLSGPLSGYSESEVPVSNCSSDTATTTSSSFHYNEKENVKALFTRDDMYVNKSMETLDVDDMYLNKSKIAASGENGEKLSLIKLANFIQVSAKKGTQELSLQGRLSDLIEWLPDSIGKLSSLTLLDLSENRVVVLPEAIGGLSSLQTLDLHGNRINELPESIGDLLNLRQLDLRGNLLKSLPPTIARLVHLQVLDLSSNGLSVLPEAIGSLVSLKKLNIETNDIEELPHTIGKCTSLKELHADYNRLKALPEAVGRIGSLEILTVRYNNIKQLPTTMTSLSSLRELDVSFNELESVPESLCFATTLVKMNISNNFADLRSLPRSIGNLEMLEELDMSNNQIRVLPDSFRMLTRLRLLNIEGNPLAVPPRDVIEKGPQAVVRYVADLLVANKAQSSQPIKQKKFWAQICCFIKPNKLKSNRTMLKPSR